MILAQQASFGVGAINFFFGLPAILLIDQWGRRKLLLWTFPFMALCLALVALGTLPNPPLPVDKEVLILLGMYLFAVFYSPGEGPVPFVRPDSLPMIIQCWLNELVIGLRC